MKHNTITCLLHSVVQIRSPYSWKVCYTFSSVFWVFNPWSRSLGFTFLVAHHSNSDKFKLWPLPRPFTETPNYMQDKYPWRPITNVVARSCTLPIPYWHHSNLAYIVSVAVEPSTYLSVNHRATLDQINVPDCLSSLWPVYILWSDFILVDKLRKIT